MACRQQLKNNSLSERLNFDTMVSNLYCNIIDMYIVQANMKRLLTSVGLCFSAILLGHMKMAVVDIKQALLSIDEKILTPELLKQLLTYAPDAAEVNVK